MAAPEGNQFYLLREKSGRNKIYTSDEIESIAIDYFQWCLNNPLEEPIWDYYKKKTYQKKVPRPFKINEFCRFAGIARPTFDDYCNSKDKDLSYISNQIKEIIKDQKFDYAAIGVFKENLIARDQGLAETQNLSITEFYVGEDNE